MRPLLDEPYRIDEWGGYYELPPYIAQEDSSSPAHSTTPLVSPVPAITPPLTPQVPQGSGAVTLPSSTPSHPHRVLVAVGILILLLVLATR